MDRRAKVELFEQIRREYEFGVGTVSAVARQFGVHRRMVRQALANAQPPERKRAQRTKHVLGPLMPWIDHILEADRKVPRKQRHTAHRLWTRLQTEWLECPIAESTVRQYVRQKKQELGLTARLICVPQCYGWGQEAQVDFYEAVAELGGEPVKLQVFTMRSMASGAAFHHAYFRATQQAFLEAHELAFSYFGGVFRTLRYDNLKAAVKKILRGYRREETTRFIAFRSHWRFLSEFCNPAEAHEKGGVEGEVGYFRRNHWVPIPQVSNLEDLNTRLLAACRQDEQRQIGNRPVTVGVAMQHERQALLPLAEQPFGIVEVCFPRVDGLGCVRVRTNSYSVPVPLGHTVEGRIYPNTVEIWSEGRCIARHERCYRRKQQILDLEHYLDVLERKPGALISSKLLAAWREKGLWTEAFDALLEQLLRRHGKQNGTQQMIQLLRFVRLYGHTRLRDVIETSLALGCYDVAAIQHLLSAEELTHAKTDSLLFAELSCFERPLPVMTDYDQLLYGEVRS